MMLTDLGEITIAGMVDLSQLTILGVDLNCVMTSVLGIMCGLVPLFVAHYGKPRRWSNQDPLALFGVVWTIALGASFWMLAGQLAHPQQLQYVTLVVLGLAVIIGATYLRLLMLRLPQLTALPDVKQLALVNQVLQQEVQERTQAVQDLAGVNEELTERLRLCTAELRRTATQLQAALADRDRAESTLQTLATHCACPVNGNPSETDGMLNAIRSQLVYGERMAGLSHMVMRCISDLERSLHNAQQDLTYLQFYAPQPQSSVPTVNAYTTPATLELPTVYESLNIEVEHISATVEALGQFAQLQDEQARPVNLFAEMAAVIEELQPRLQASSTRPAITVQTEIPQTAEVMGCAGQLRQVCWHLLTNAIDAIDTANPSNPQLQITLEPSPRHVYLRITDNGIGMMPHMLKRLFEPFYTTKRPGQGVGLGLALCYQIVVDYHCGQIQCHSTYRRGTSVEVVLPRAEPTTVATIDTERTMTLTR